MLESYEIKNLEQLHAISDEFRLRILDLLQESPKTVTQLGEMLGQAPARVHYHVRELEKVGLVLLVNVREKGGILEKYYQPIAREILVAKNLLLSGSNDEVLATIDFWFDRIKTNFVRALKKETATGESISAASWNFHRVYLTPEEREQVRRQIAEILTSYGQKRGREGEEAVLSLHMMVSEEIPLFVASTLTPEESTSSSSSPPPAWEEPATINVRVLGVAAFSRGDLEQAIARQQKCRISVIGVCRFDRDIDASLVDQAVAHFHLVGRLVASPEVRAVLLRKKDANTSFS